jgi:RNA polymerase sigma-70 factor, ECF subfamily
MLAATTAFKDSSLPLPAAAEAQEFRREAERRREFEDILSHALPRFRQVAMRWLGNREDAEDAVQDAMLSAFKHIARFGGRAKMSTWLMAIVVNAVRMQIRARPRGRMLSLDWAPIEGQPAISELLVDPRPNPEKTLEQSELRELVIRLTGSLQSSQKAALRLRHQKDFSIREAAATLKVPEGTLKARLARGRAKLAERFHHAMAQRKIRTSVFRPKTRRRASSLDYRPKRVRLAQVPIAVFAEQGGCEAWVSA